MSVNVKITGVEALVRKLNELNRFEMDAINKKQATEILNKARTSYTPVDTGELRLSSSMNYPVVGYTKEYAPHVEYGHRNARGGGYTQGQYFLKANVMHQQKIYIDDIKERLKRYGL